VTAIEAEWFFVLMLLAALGVAEALRVDDAGPVLLGGDGGEEIVLRDLEELLVSLLAGLDGGGSGDGGEGGGRGRRFDEWW
jgi:hypothetical protein